MIRHPPVRSLALGLLLTIVAGSCTTNGGPGPPGPRSASASASATSPSPSPTVTTAPIISLTVAFIEALDGEEADDRVAPAFQGARLAFSNAEVVTGLAVDVEVVAYDTEGDPTRADEIAAEIVTTPEIVAAIGAPGLTDQAAIGDALDAAGVPWISLSGAGSGLGDRDWTGWRRLVADQVVQGTVLAQTVDALKASGHGVCLLGDGTAPARSLLGAAVRTLQAEIVLRAAVPGAQPDVAAAVGDVAEAGCGVVLWGGEGSAGAALRGQLVREGLRRVAFVGSDRIRDQSFLEAAGRAGEGTLATCPSVDVSTSTDLAAQRFIQDYQSEFGLPPGPYAVEAWDAARMLVAAFRGGAVERGPVSAALEVMRTFDGLAGTYRFGFGGDLADAAASVRISRVEGGRWLEIATS
ncbi:MAG: branched-chain amino acid ABC transporter substrate-binding protein, partial [Actinomycetota bacterium]